MEDTENDKLYLHFKERFKKKHPDWSEEQISYISDVALSYINDLIEGKIDVKNPPTVEQYLHTYDARKNDQGK